MPGIKWVGVIRDTGDYQNGSLPQGAVKLNMPDTINSMMVKAMPFIIPPIAVICLSMLVKTLSAGQAVVSPLFVVIGILLGFFVGAPAHELLHAVVYPRGTAVYIGIMPKQLAAVALVSCPISRSRFILMSLAPAALGVIPLILFFITPAAGKALNGLLFGLFAMGLTAPYPDYYNVYQVLKQTNKNCLLQFHKDDLYYIPAYKN